MDRTTLRDLGERQIIADVLARRYSADNPRFGDDCVELPPVPATHRVVVSTDPCPEPMAATLGFSDLYYRGWLLATINLSDLGAAGATPIGLLTSLVFPADTAVGEFEQLLDGIDACCAAVGARVLGGNLKEGARIDLQATAIGLVREPPLSRFGSSPGDVVAVIGDLGEFWAGSLAVLRGLPMSAEDRSQLLTNVLTPRPRVAAGAALRQADLVSAAMDNSDGLGPTLEALASANTVGVELDIAPSAFSAPVLRVAGALHVDPMRLALGWGDWQLVVTIPPEHVQAVESGVRASGDELTIIGRVVQGAGVWLWSDGALRRLHAPDSERFVADSWFTAGIDSYIERLVEEPFTL